MTAYNGLHKKEEEMWHKVFAHRHHHGEWYEF